MPSFTWSPEADRYRGPDGRFVSEQSLRSAVDTVVDASTIRIQTLTTGLQAGSTSLAEWQAGMMQELRQSHLAAVMAARGGQDMMSQADYGWTGAQIKSQYQYLRNFAAEVANGAQPLDGRLLVRAELYGQSARGSYEEARRRDMRTREENQERRVRHATDSCVDCVAEAGQGWQALGSLRRIGDSQCRSRCRCRFEFRRAPVEQAA